MIQELSVTLLYKFSEISSIVGDQSQMSLIDYIVEIKEESITIETTFDVETYPF